MINGKACDLRDKICPIFCLIIALLRERGVNCSQRCAAGTRMLRSHYDMAPFPLSFNICSINIPKKLYLWRKWHIFIKPCRLYMEFIWALNIIKSCNDICKMAEVYKLFSMMKPTWCTFYSVYWESKASTCFEHYLLILRRCYTKVIWYIACVLCELAVVRLQWNSYTHVIYQMSFILCRASWGWANSARNM
jgi:hypothetical protein